jgi:cysteine peptidase C11 family protein
MTNWNLLIYAIDGGGQEHSNVAEALAGLRAGLTAEHVNVAVQVMAKGETTRHWIAARREPRTESLADVADGSRAASLTGFLDAARQKLPAASTALVLWAHGSGIDHVHDAPAKRGGGLGGLSRWTPRATGPQVCAPWITRAPPPYGCRWGPDPNSGQFLTNVTMKKAIAASQLRHVDLLGLNACWMAALEVEYELRGVAGIEVASQVYAKPWPYRAIAEALSRTPAPSAEQLARTIAAAVRAEISLGEREDAVSAFRAGRAFDELAAAFDIYARRVTELVDSDWPAVREAVMQEALRIDDPLQADLASLVTVLGRQDPRAREAAQAVAGQLSAMRIANVAHRSHLHVEGLSVLCPKDTNINLADAYQGTEFRSNSWAGFLAKLQAKLATS